jgi:hypothetical protein
MYRYFLTERPVSPGCQPNNFSYSESWDEKLSIENQGITRMCWGWVDYEDKLNQKDIDDYELWEAESNFKN